MSYIVNTMIADDLVTQGTKSSTATVLSEFSWNITASQCMDMWLITLCNGGLNGPSHSETSSYNLNLFLKVHRILETL